MPRDRVSEIAAELAPVFDSLADVSVEAYRLRNEAQDLAGGRRQEAADRAGDIVAESGNRMAEVRATAATAHLDEAARRQAAALAQGRRLADQVGRRAAERLPVFVTLVVDAVSAYGIEGTSVDGDAAAGGARSGGGLHKDAEPQDDVVKHSQSGVR